MTVRVTIHNDENKTVMYDLEVVEMDKGDGTWHEGLSTVLKFGQSATRTVSPMKQVMLREVARK